MSYNEDDICVICSSKPSEELCIPCGHKMICTECSLKLRGTRPSAVAGKCMYCNKKIEKLLTDHGDVDFIAIRPPIVVPSLESSSSSRENACPGCSRGFLVSKSIVIGGVNTHQCTRNWEECNSCRYKTSSHDEWD